MVRCGVHASLVVDLAVRKSHCRDYAFVYKKSK